MAKYLCLSQLVKSEDSFLSFLILTLYSKYPPTLSVMMPIFVRYPFQRLVVVPACRPPLQLQEDYVVKFREHHLRGHISKIVCPAHNLRIELSYHVSLLCRSHVVDYFMRCLRKLLLALLAWLYQQFAVPILAYVEAEEVEAIFYMCYQCLFLRELQPSFP